MVRTADPTSGIAGERPASRAGAEKGDAPGYYTLTSDGKKQYYSDIGEYNPVISDGVHLYLTGTNIVARFTPRKPRKHPRKAHHAQGKHGNGKHAAAKHGKPHHHPPHKRAQAKKEEGLESDVDAVGAQAFLRRAHRVPAVVEDRGAEHRVGPAVDDRG